MPGKSKKGGGLEIKSSFKMRSGNGPLPFKQMGASPANFTGISDFDTKTKNNIKVEQQDANSSITKVSNKAIEGPGADNVKRMPQIGDPEKSTGGPVKPSKSFKEVSTETKRRKAVADKEDTIFNDAKDDGNVVTRGAKKLFKKSSRQEIGKALETAGEGISRAYGKNGTGSIMTAYSQMKQQKESQKSQDILDQTRKLSNEQKIKETELALDGENKLKETPRFIGGITKASDSTAAIVAQIAADKAKMEKELGINKG